MYSNLGIIKIKYDRAISEVAKKLKNIVKLMPDIKIKISQDKKINKVWPMSGCIINKSDIGKILIKLKKYL